MPEGAWRYCDWHQGWVPASASTPFTCRRCEEHLARCEACASQQTCPHCSAPLDDTVTLFRPVGPKELELIRQSGYRAFPPRLPTQPIFYPVLYEDYAVQIARDWNATDAATGYRGYVTRFRVKEGFLQTYEVHTVGSSRHREYWIPADDLPSFNDNIVGLIEVIHEFR